MNRRQALLAAALVATLAAAGWFAREDLQDPPTPARKPRPAAAAAAVAAVAAPALPASLRLPVRTAEEGAAGELFASKNWLPPQVEAAPVKPTAPPLPFTYMGRYVVEGEPRVFLSRGDQLFMVKAGDTIDGAYRVERIDSAMTFIYLPLGETQVLAIGGMQ